MSLIEEALRRVKDPMLAQTEAGAPPKNKEKKAAPSASEPESAPVAHSWPTAPSLPTTASPTSAQRSSHRTLSAGVALALLLGAVYLFGGTTWTKRTVAARRPAAPLSTIAAPAAGAVAPSLTAQASPDGLILSGVLEGEGESFAMINGAIVKVGESIGDWTLLSVAEGTATLRNESGREAVLRVPR